MRLIDLAGIIPDDSSIVYQGRRVCVFERLYTDLRFERAYSEMYVISIQVLNDELLITITDKEVE